MKKSTLTRKIARRSHVPSAAAADHVDAMVTDLIRRLRTGEPARLPGLGIFRPDQNEATRFIIDRKEDA